MKINLKDFLELHQGGVAQTCITIHQLPYDQEQHCYARTYFEEAFQCEIIESKLFRKIAKKKVHHFYVYDENMILVSLNIILEEDKNVQNKS